MKKHDVFISYATQDNDFASEIAYRLKSNGLSVWFAPLTLKVGDKLLDSIENGIENSRNGILIISKCYLSKKWTKHEMDILIRQHIEFDKKLLQLWVDVDKTDIDKRHSTLSGLVAIEDTKNISQVISKLLKNLSDGAPSLGIIPSWENPAYRFLQGLGEVGFRSSNAPASTITTTTIFEFLLYSKPEQYPLWLAGETYSKKRLLTYVAKMIGPVPERVKKCVDDEGFNRLFKMCVEHDLHPNIFY